MLIGNTQNRKFCRASRIANPAQRKANFERILCDTTCRQNATSRISRKPRFARRSIKKFVVTAEFGVLRTSRDQHLAGLCCAARRRPGLAFFQPFDWSVYTLFRSFRWQTPGHQQEIWPSWCTHARHVWKAWRPDYWRVRYYMFGRLKLETFA